MRKNGLALCLLLSLCIPLASCNEEITGTLTFMSDGGTLYYHTSDSEELKELTSSDYKSSTADSVTFEGVATTALPDQIKYLTASKDGYKFMGWKQLLKEDTLASYYEDFSTGKKWNYSTATYKACYEKYVTLRFVPLKATGKVENEDGTTTTTWAEWTDGPAVITKDVYTSYGFNAKELQAIVSEMNAKLDDLPDSADGFDYSEYGSFNNIIKSIDDENSQVNTIEVSEDALTYYLPYNENSSITYTYPEGALTAKGGSAINPLTETKYAHGEVTALSDAGLQPTYLEPYVEGKKFLGWYFSAEEEKDETKVDFSPLATGEKIDLNGTYEAYAKFEGSIAVNINVDTANWNYTAPSGTYFAGDVITVDDLGTTPTAKSGNDVFDFWYYDADNDGTFGDGDEEISEKADFIVPSNVTEVNIRFQRKTKPILYIDLTGVKSFWNTDKLVNDYGFTQSNDNANIYYAYVAEGEQLWSSTSEDTILGNVKTAITDSNRFVLDGFLLTSKGDVPYNMTSTNLTVIPTYTRKEKVVIHYATAVSETGVATYDTTGVTNYYEIGFASSFGNDAYDLNGVAENTKFPSTEAEKTYVGYEQWGWKEGVDGTESRSFTVSEYASAESYLDLYAVMKKKVSLSLTLYESSPAVTMTLERFVGDEIPYAAIAKGLNVTDDTVFVCSVQTQEVLGHQVVVATPITQIPEANGSYTVLTKTQYQNLNK